MAPLTNVTFIHIQKTAGTSIVKWLSQSVTNTNISPPNCHLTASEYRSTMGVLFEDSFKFAFIRNPYERAVSYYKYKMTYYGKTLLTSTQRDKRFVDWNVWLEDTLHKLPSQMSYIADSDNNIIVDFVGRFENLNTDLQIVARTIGIPLPRTMFHELPTAHTDYSTFLDQSARKIIEKIYPDDIEYFNRGVK